MNSATVTEVHRLFEFGNAYAPPERVFGGLLHQMYHFRTARGEFAVKLLNPTIMRYDNVRERFRLSERIAASVAAAGLPAVTALQSNGKVLHDIGEDTVDSVMVYPWIRSAPPPVPPVSAGPDRAHRIGHLLGCLHALPLDFPELQVPSVGEVADGSVSTMDADTAEWVALVEDADRKQILCAQELRALLPQINEWTCSASRARHALLTSDTSQRVWVISHSDLDQKNVLWSNHETPHLIDWESAGYVQPAIEAVGTALDWSGQGVGNLDTGAFNAFLEGYRRTASLSAQEVRWGLDAYCGNWCGWLKFSLQRAVGAVTDDQEEQALGRREVESTLVLLRSATVNLPGLALQLTDI